MKKLIPLFACMLIGLAACSKKNTDLRTDLDTAWTPDFKYFSNKAIDTFTHARTGNLNYNMMDQQGSTVFHCVVATGVNDRAFDNEYSTVVVFQTDSEATSFSYTDEEMAAHRTHYYIHGAWTGTEQQLLNKGQISGHKLPDNTWSIKVNVKLNVRDEIADTDAVVREGVYTPVKY